MAEQLKKTEEPVKVRPRIGRWELTDDGEVILIGSECTSCGESFFPEHRACVLCGSEQTAEMRLRGPAKLFSYTVVHQLPAGFDGPLVVGYGEFEGGVLVLAPIDAAPDRLREGQRLALHIGVTRIDEDGEQMLSYRFRPAGV